MPIADPVIARMRSLIDEWDQHSDRRAIFLTCYIQMTENMHRAVQEGEFHDPAWIVPLINRFSDYYFSALDNYEAGDFTRTPGAWGSAFKATLKGLF